MVDYDYGEAITTEEENIPKYKEAGYFDFIEQPVPGLEGPEFSQLHRDRSMRFDTYKGYAKHRFDRMHEKEGGKISPEHREELISRGQDERDSKRILDYHTENIGQTAESEVYPYMQAEYVKGIRSAMGPKISTMISEGVEPGEIIDYWNRPLYRTPYPGDKYGQEISSLRRHYNRDYDKTLGELPVGTTIEDLKNIDFKDQPWNEGDINTFPNFPTLHPGEVSQGAGQDLAGGLETAGFLRGFQENLDKDLEDGTINQEQYDAILSSVTEAGQWGIDEYMEARGFTKSPPTVEEEVFDSVKNIDDEPIF